MKKLISIICLTLLSFTARAAQPDIIVTTLDYNNGKFNSIVKNQGTTAIPAVYISISYLINGTEHSYAKVMGPLASGATLNLGSVSAKILPNGTYTVTAFADNLNRFAESNEANNKLTKTIVIGGGPPPSKDINITKPSVNEVLSGTTTLTATSNMVLPVVIPKAFGPVTTHIAGGPTQLPATWNKAYPMSDPTNSGGWVVNPALTDSFNSTTLDSTKWWDTMKYAGQGALASNVVPTVNGLELHMCTTINRPSCVPAGSYNVRGSYIQNKTRVLYGYFETILRVAPNFGNSNVFLYAMSPNNNRTGLTEWTELDVTELHGTPPGAANRHSMNAHLWPSSTRTKHESSQTQYLMPTNTSFATNFHAYGFKWTPTLLSWYLDGRLVRTMPNSGWHQPLDFYIGIWESSTLSAASLKSTGNLYNTPMIVRSTKAWTSNKVDSVAAGITFYSDGIKIGTEDTEAPYSVSWDTTKVANGIHSLIAVLRDAVGNTFTSPAIPVTISNKVTPPTPQPIDSAIQGFAAVAGVTGGAGGQNIVVTNCNGDSSTGSLKAAIAVNTTRIITFKPGMTCIINWPSSAGAVHVNTPNMTIDGKGANITISGMALNVFSNGSVSPTHNIIIRNLTFGNTTPDRSAIMIAYGSRDIWVDHNTFYNNSTGNISGQGIAIYNFSTTKSDGGVSGLTGITISWNHFKAPNGRAFAVGSESHNTGNTVTLYGRVSMHHNWYENVSTRMPRAHSKGNVIHEWNNYAAGSWSEMPVTISQGSSYLGEGNIYEPRGPIYQITANHDYYYPTDLAEGILQRNPYLLNGAKSTNFGTFPISKITYSVVPETANDALKARIIQGAGAH